MKTTIVYKDHVIIAAGKRDERTGKYKSLIHLSWTALDGTRECHAFSLPEACEIFEDASALALAAAKTWTDRCLIYVGP
jgi:hypothetical protein